MFKWFKSKPAPIDVEKEARLAKALKEKLEWWDGLDPRIKVMAVDTFKFTSDGYDLQLNQVGTWQLTEHLAKHGLKIVRDDNPNK